MSENLVGAIPLHVGMEYSSHYGIAQNPARISFTIDQVQDLYSVRTENGWTLLNCVREFLEEESTTCYSKTCTRDGVISTQKEVPHGYKCAQLTHHYKV